MKRRVSINEVYERLIGIHPDCKGQKQYAKEIADDLRVSSVAIHKVIEKLKDNEYIIPAGKRTNINLYSPTKKKPPAKWLTKSCNHAGVGTFQGSKSQWCCPITKMPQELKGWDIQEMQNGVIQYLLEYPFVKPADGLLKFRILGKSNFTISVDYSQFNLTEEDVIENKKCPPWVKDYVKMALQWVKKKYNIAMDVNDVRPSFSPHLETELRDADAKKYIETARITIEFSDGQKIMINRSNKKDNFETTFPPWLKEYVDLPSYRERFCKMEEELIPRILKIDDKLDRLLSLYEQGQIISKNREKENLERGVI